MNAARVRVFDRARVFRVPNFAHMQNVVGAQMTKIWSVFAVAER